MKQYYKEYVENDGKHPNNENKKWETKEQLNSRVMSIINKYAKKYDKVIIVGHKIAFQSICNCKDIKPGEIFEIDF